RLRSKLAKTVGMIKLARGLEPCDGAGAAVRLYFNAIEPVALENVGVEITVSQHGDAVKLGAFHVPARVCCPSLQRRRTFLEPQDAAGQRIRNVNSAVASNDHVVAQRRLAGDRACRHIVAGLWCSALQIEGLQCPGLCSTWHDHTESRRVNRAGIKRV